MSPGELESMRREGEQHGLSRRETLTLLEHLDAVADQRNVAMSRLFDCEKSRNETTADRDEARQEVAALRAQRDEIREAHRVEAASLTARLEAAVRERDDEHAAGRYAEHDDWVRSLRSVMGPEWDGGMESAPELIGELRAKLAVLVEAADLVVATAERQGEFDGCPIEAIASALRAVRGET